MKTKSATVILAGLLVSMIGVAWSQNSNTAGNTNSTSNALPRNRATGGRGRDVGPANRNPYKSDAYANMYGWPPADSNTSANGWVYHPEAANSGNAWSYVGNSQPVSGAVNANTMTNVAANKVGPARKMKPRRPVKKPRKIAGTTTVGKLLAAALAAGLSR